MALTPESRTTSASAAARCWPAGVSAGSCPWPVARSACRTRMMVVSWAQPDAISPTSATMPRSARRVYLMAGAYHGGPLWAPVEERREEVEEVLGVGHAVGVEI